MTDVFISYSKLDKNIIEELATFLTAEGYVVWWDTSLLTGENYRSSINAQLDAAKAVIVIWSRNSIRSEWVVSEAEHAARRGNLIPLRMADMDIPDIPKPYNTRHTDLVDNRAAIKAALQRLGVEARYAKGVHGSLHDRFWKEIENSDHPEDYKLYLKEFPEGEHAAFARLKVARLERAAAVAKPGEPLPLVVAPVVQQPGPSRGLTSPLSVLALSLSVAVAVAAGLWKFVIVPSEAVKQAQLDTMLAELRRPVKEDDDDWARAEADGLLRSWNDYLRRRPAGLHEREARERIAKRLEAGRLLHKLDGQEGPIVRLEVGETANTLSASPKGARRSTGTIEPRRSSPSGVDCQRS